MRDRERGRMRRCVFGRLAKICFRFICVVRDARVCKKKQKKILLVIAYPVAHNLLCDQLFSSGFYFSGNNMKTRRRKRKSM